MANSMNLNEMTSKRLRHKMEIQHTNRLAKKGSRIDLKRKNKARIFQF